MGREEIVEDVRRMLRILPTDVVELRCLHVGRKNRTFAGWFDGAHLDDLARLSLAYSRMGARGVYVTLNTVGSEVHARCTNDVKEATGARFSLTKDCDIVTRKRFLVDLDPIRLGSANSECPTTEPELQAAVALARSVVVPALDLWGFGEPIACCSGNGVHLVYELSEPVDLAYEGYSDPVQSLLLELSNRYSTDRVKIDPGTYKPSILVKVPGTWARKGAESVARKYRQASIIKL